MKQSDASNQAPNRVPIGLAALFGQAKHTKAEFDRILADFPEVLTEEAQRIGAVLAAQQSTPSATASVKQMMSLLKYCGELGVERAWLEHMVRQRREGSNARLAQARQRLLAERRLLPPTGVPRRTSLPSLGECARELRKTFREELVKVRIKSVENPADGATIEADLPRFFFRGEPGDYPSTISSRNRLMRRTDLPLDAIEDILRCTFRIQANLVLAWKISPFLAEGFLQHYGMATTYVDLTYELNVAVSFASDLEVGKVGRLCVVPIDGLAENGQLIDLSHHPFAERPGRQRGFAWASEHHCDLKAPAA